MRPESCRRTPPAADLSTLAPSAKAVAGQMRHLRNSPGFIQEANWRRARLKAGTPEARQGEWQPSANSCEPRGDLWGKGRRADDTGGRGVRCGRWAGRRQP